jgi:hypothetical protein
MAELNFGLLTPPGSQSIGNAFVQGMDQAAVARARENQNALSQYTLSKARREDTLANQILAGMQGADTIEKQADVLRRGGKYREANELINAGLERRYKLGQIETNAAKLPGERAKAFQEVLKPYSAAAYNARNVDEGVASVKAMYANPPIAAVLTKIKSLEQAIADTTAAFGDPKTRAQWRQHWGGITPEKLFEAAQKNQDPLARAIAYRDSLPPGSPDYNAIQAKITQFENQNRVLNTVTGEFKDRRQQPPGGAPAPSGFVDRGIAEGVTPQMQAPSVDAARQQAIAMDAANLPVNIRVGGNALPGAQPPAPDVNALRAQLPAATATTPSNPRQELDDFQTQRRLEETGYRRTPQGQEFIPGGKADPAAAYRNIVTTAAANDDMTQVKRAQSLPQDFTKIDETLNILRNTDINTGLGAALFTVLDKARSQVAADKKAGKRAVNTEYLDALLGSDVFPQIQALGIGARGLDTPAERDYLRKVLTGSIGLTKDTLIKMTELRRKGLENEAARFNKRVEKGEFKLFGEAARRKVEAVTVPPLPTTEAKWAPSAIPQAAIDDLNAGRGTPAQFDEQFGAGAAARARGKK